MHEIDGAYVRVSIVGCVSHTVCPLTEQFELFVCHHVLEFCDSVYFFCAVKVTHDFYFNQVYLTCLWGLTSIRS